MCNGGRPTVAMLWEDADPAQALADRFGLRDGAEAGRWVPATVAQHWGITVDDCGRIEISDRNALAWLTTSAGPHVAKWSAAPQRFRRLEQVDRIVVRLGRMGLPVVAPLITTAGGPRLERPTYSMSLQPVVDGDLLDVGRPDQVHAAGVALADLHGALGMLAEPADGIEPHDHRSTLADRVAEWRRGRGTQASRPVREALDRLLAGAPEPDVSRHPVQLVHGDFRSSNLLMHGPRVAAVIDFEEMRHDHCVDELARSAVMLGTRFREWGPVSPAVHATLRSGYESRRPLTAEESRWWEVLVLWYSAPLVPDGDDPTGWGDTATLVATGRSGASPGRAPRPAPGAGH